MTNRIELNWDVPYAVDEQRYYCSETSIDPENLPIVKAILSGDANSYIDTNIELGKIYYICIIAIKNNVEIISDIQYIQAGDKYRSNVISLLHFDDNIIDSAGLLSYNAVGSLSYNSNSKFGKSLNLLGRSCLLTANSTNIRLMDSDYTIECFIRASSFTKVTVDPVIISIGNNNNLGTQEIILGINSITGKLFYRVYQDDVYIIDDITSSIPLQLNNWEHVAISRYGLDHYIFLNGIKVSTFTTTNNYTLANIDVDLIIGGIISSGSKINWGRFDGLIDEFRFTKGIARYTEDFIPQIIPFSL